ncbi:OmpP1/FadL family transporter [Lutibacter sp. B1]|uniref:OmpP1/FadL family transporter n=1 Tax=Lutibacter sp. B1 TaxID=2725996 RepID=UPI0014568B8B|nr:hypothetical protein [Lutibacter sp. B1]NLP58537.1 hypothetical protein [Lutibacter sp. B1]
MNLKLFILTLFSFSTLVINAQSDSSSPYSLYGLGMENSNYFGGFTALGNTGIGYRSSSNINKSNPASLSSTSTQSFLYEFGLNSTFSNKKDKSTTQHESDFNFTHLAMAFALKNNWGLSFGLLPYTKVNYEIDIVKPIEGNTNYYLTNIIGAGGINQVFFSSGIKVVENLSFGVEIAALFGSITQKQWIYVGNTTSYIKKSDNFFGLGLNAGIQYTIKNIVGTETTIGATINMPTTLNGKNHDFEGYKTMEGTQISIYDNSDDDLNDFDLPLKLGIGISSKINANFLVNMDYRKNYWSETDQTSSNNSFNNQTIYGIGVEYKLSSDLNNYWNRAKYRAGFNYNTGYLKITDEEINNYNFSIGVGLPISKDGVSNVNINYSYGKEGTIKKQLVEDKYHKLSINLSLLGHWFQKQKIF